MLLLIGEGGTIPIRDETILALKNDNLPALARAGRSASFCIAGYAANLRPHRGEPPAGRACGRSRMLAVGCSRSASLAVILVAATAYLSKERSRNPASPRSRVSRSSSWCW